MLYVIYCLARDRSERTRTADGDACAPIQGESIQQKYR